MNKVFQHTILTCFIAVVWIANGLICKVLNFVPRHEKIVAQILGANFSRPLTILIGIGEIIMAAWILSNYKKKLNAILQIAIVAIMNLLEIFLVPDLLLWGKLNGLFALIFIMAVYYNQFYLGNFLKR